MSDVRWSEWIEWNGGECPLDKGSDCEIRFANGSWVREDRPEVYAWASDVGGAGRIIAYRYKIEEPSGISEADEEECIQLAYERMNEEIVKVSIEELQDNVNKPKHYQLREGYEVYDLRQDLAAKAANGGATYDQYSDWDRAIEYIIRMWGKNRLEDAKKGRWYLDKLIEKLEAE